MNKIIFLFFSILLISAFASFYFYQNFKSVSSENTPKEFLIEKGTGASQIGRDLEEAGLIRSQFAFKVYIMLTGQANKLQKGEFRLSPNMNLFEVVSTLQKGAVELWVTIPEGLRREEIAKKFADGLNKDQAFINEFLALSKSKEGYLFPDTYLFPKEVSANVVYNAMINTFEQKTAELNLTFEQVILASLLERETKTDAERPIVAGIIYNRLRENWPLQIDASTQYGVGTSNNWWPILTLKDLESNSPFNTYKFTGLPPAPIANAGISSLRAAVNPEASEYYFYIHAPNGQIYYAKTLSEHNENIRKYLGK